MNDEQEAQEMSGKQRSAADRPLDAPEQDGRGPQAQSFGRIAYRQLVHNRLAMAGFAMIVIVATVAVFVPFLANDKPYVIHTTLDDDYEQAYFSCLYTMKELTAVGGTESDVGKTLSSDIRTVLQNLGRMATQLDEGGRKELARVEEEFRAHLGRTKGGHEVRGIEQFKAALGRMLPEFEAKFALENVTLVAHYYFPLLHSLRSLEIFFLILWLAAVVQWAVRRRSPPTAQRAVKVVVAAVVIAGLWDLTIHKKVYPTGYFKRRIPKASFALMPPVPYGETEIILSDEARPPSWQRSKGRRGPAANYHVLGTDTRGRDVLSRMIYGARVAMIVGFVAVSIYVTIGVVLGAFAGFFRGKIDMLVSRIIEVVICFPTLFLILTVLAMLRPSIINIMIVIGLTGWTGVARLTRGEFLRIVNLDYVSAVQALGGSSLRIIFRHILPNGVGPVLVVASFGIAVAILVESALSFLGLGVPPPHASWGTILNEARAAGIQDTWWLTIFPGLAIFLTVTAWNLFGEGLRDAIDPRLKQ